MNDVKEWLDKAAVWRWSSLLFQSPTHGTLAQLRDLVNELREEHRDRARELTAASFEDWEVEFHRVLGPGGSPACESSYDKNALAGLLRPLPYPTPAQDEP